MIVPALPPSVGPNENKARFFAEASSAFELLAVFHLLTAEEQEEFRKVVAGFAAAAANRKVNSKGKS